MNKYPQAECVGQAIDAQRPSLTDRLTREKKDLERRLSEVNTVLEKLEANPEFAETMDAITKLGHLY